MNAIKLHLHRIPNEQKMLLIKRLSLYIHTGISLPRAFEFLLENASSKYTRLVLQKTEGTILQGGTLSRGLSEFPRDFDVFTIGLLEAGETSGKLADTLDHLAATLQKRISLRQKIHGALLYPIIVLLGTIAVTGFLTLFIFPKIVPILRGLHTSLPFSTKVLIWIDSFFASYWIYTAAGILAAVIIFLFAIRKSWVRIRCEQLLLHCPLLGLLYKHYILSTTFSMLSIQLQGGIRIVPALDLVQRSILGEMYPRALEKVSLEITEGQRLSDSFRGQKQLFPPVVYQLVSAGEATGTLRENTLALAELFEERLDDLTKNMTVLIEPILMACMGVVVGFVALAIITPIYKVTQSINIK